MPSLKRSELELACEDFSNVIGILSDYMVYKGTLSSGVEIAVVSTTKSSAKEWSKHCEAQFRKKVEMLLYLLWRFVVKLKLVKLIVDRHGWPLFCFASDNKPVQS